MALAPAAELNAICPYFTMFPLSFPLQVLSRRALPGDMVLDPFCGRGTTNFAARLTGLYSVGVDSSPVAAAIAAAKVVAPTPASIVTEARAILGSGVIAPTPQSEFWHRAFDQNVLSQLCRLRSALNADCGSPARQALRAIILGGLHGPTGKKVTSYFSNQCPRTYSPKPAYAVKFWQTHKLNPPSIDVLELIGRRASRYFGRSGKQWGVVRLADSRVRQSLALTPRRKFRWIVTSPPYYGMRTYVPDQWLRNWFVGGPDAVDYSTSGQVAHSSVDAFVEDLRVVWANTATVATEDAALVVRFGGITDRSADPRELVKESFVGSGWRIQTIKNAGSASEGRRQADAFLRSRSSPLEEYDVWAAQS